MSERRPVPPWILPVAVGALLRALPLLIWGWSSGDCTRDECIYKIVATHLVESGELRTAPAGWIPAPGYPAFLALMQLLTGTVQAAKWVQIGLFGVTTWTLWRLTDRVHGARAAVIAAWLYALHPTFAFYAGTLWTETAYTAILLGAALSAMWSVEGAARRAVVPGLLLGVAVLFRGIATWLTPLFALAILWDAPRDRLRHAAVLALTTALTVAPYSLLASRQWGGFILTDATLGHVAEMGNNDHPPMTFDYAIGQLDSRQFSRSRRAGRPDCPAKDPLTHDRCEVDRAVQWVQEHPGEFVGRIPERLAQLYNPNTFLTRHVRWGLWEGLPFVLKEAIVLWTALSSYVVMIGGTIGAAAWARGPYGRMAVGTALYTSAVIACLYGLSRFRLPLEGMWLVYLAIILADPRGTVRALRERPARAAAGAVAVAALGWLSSWYLLTGWPMFW
jgi:hypothetical protein